MSRRIIIRKQTTPTKPKRVIRVHKKNLQSGHPEQLLISAMLRQEDHVLPASNGVTKDWFHAYPDEYAYIERYISKFRRTPSKASFKRHFPDFELVATDSVDEHIDDVRESHARHALLTMVDRVADGVSEGKEFSKLVRATEVDLIRLQQQLEGTAHETEGIVNWRVAYEEVSRRVERTQKHGKAGMPTGFPTLDDATGGPQPGEYWIIASRLGLGKALANNTLVMTPIGYRPIRDLKVGDRVIGSAGKSVEVIGVFPQGQKQIYEVTFNDHSIIEACEDHLWNVRIGSKPWRVQTTGQISKHEGQQLSIPQLSGPIQFRETHVPYDAYKLGLLLGDGCFRGREVTFSTADPELVAPFGRNAVYRGQYDYGLNGYAVIMRKLGLMGLYSHNKHIPGVYKVASIRNRLAILQGLFDTDGYAMNSGSVEYSTSSPQLAEDVQFIVESLGGVVRATRRPTKCRPSYRLIIALPPSMPPFRLGRKLIAWIPRTKHQPSRQIVSAIPTTRYTEMTCIAVDAPDSLFVIEHGLVTHNTWTCINMGVNAILNNYIVQYDALEQSRTQVIMRVHNLLSPKYASSIFRSNDLMLGKGFDLLEYKQFLRKMSTKLDGRFFVNDTTRGKVTPSVIAAQIERNKPGVLFIDYITLMGEDSDDWRAVKRLSGDLKGLAVEYNIPIVCAAQINRGGIGTKGSTHPPGPESLTGSDAIGQDADAVITLAKPSLHVIRMRLAKYRNGPDGQLWWNLFNPGNGRYEEVAADIAREQMEEDEQASK